jgi:hypothetical protein
MAGIFLVLLLVALLRAQAYQKGEVVTANFRSLHDNWRTAPEDLPLHNMPRFCEEDKFIIHARIPQEGSITPSSSGDSSQGRKANSAADVKTSFTFANSLQVPWTVVYDAKRKRSLSKLVLIFSHDKYDIVKVQTERLYSETQHKVDLTHPSTLGFEVE